jgi:hypothetical protein
LEISSGEKKHKRMAAGIDLTKSNLTLTSPSAGVGLKMALFMELRRDYPFPFYFLLFVGGCGERKRE